MPEDLSRLEDIYGDLWAPAATGGIGLAPIIASATISASIICKIAPEYAFCFSHFDRHDG